MQKVKATGLPARKGTAAYLSDFMVSRQPALSQIPSYPSQAIHGLNTSLLRETQSRTRAAHLMNNVLALKEDITKDAEANTIISLNTTEASTSTIIKRSVVDVFTRNSLLDTTNSDGEIREGSSAREDVTALSSIVLCTADLGVVGLDDGGVGVDEGCAGVEDTGDGLGGGGGTDAVGGGAEAPETLAVVGGDVGDGARVLALVDVAEVVGAGGVVLELDGEKGRRELRLDGVEEGLLLLGLHRVDGGHGQAEQTVRVDVL